MTTPQRGPADQSLPPTPQRAPTAPGAPGTPEAPDPERLGHSEALEAELATLEATLETMVPPRPSDAQPDTTTGTDGADGSRVEGTATPTS